MKFHDIQEASYQDQSEWVEWVRAQFNKVGPDDRICLGNERKVPVEYLKSIIDDLTRTFGKPNREDPYKDLNFQWVWQLGGADGYRVVVFPWGTGTQYAGICVGRGLK